MSQPFSPDTVCLIPVTGVHSALCPGREGLSSLAFLKHEARVRGQGLACIECLRFPLAAGVGYGQTPVLSTPRHRVFQEGQMRGSRVAMLQCALRQSDPRCSGQGHVWLDSPGSSSRPPSQKPLHSKFRLTSVKKKTGGHRSRELQAACLHGAAVRWRGACWHAYGPGLYHALQGDDTSKLQQQQEPAGGCRCGAVTLLFPSGLFCGSWSCVSCRGKGLE